VPERWGSWCDVALVIPHRAGAWQGLRGEEPKGWKSQLGVNPEHGWGMAWPKGQGSQQSVDPTWCWGPAHPSSGDPGGSGAGLGLGAVRGVDSPVERSSSSAGLWGGDLAGWLFY
jgi:hypothetical protein